MKTITTLLLVGLLGCIKPPHVEAPAEIHIQPMSPSFPKEEVVMAMTPKWFVERANPWNTDVVSSSRFEAVYGYGDYKIVASVISGKLHLDCSSGVSTVSSCDRNAGTFVYNCQNMSLTIRCQFVKIINGVEEEIPENKNEEQEATP